MNLISSIKSSTSYFYNKATECCQKGWAGAKQIVPYTLAQGALGAVVRASGYLERSPFPTSELRDDFENNLPFSTKALQFAAVNGIIGIALPILEECVFRGGIQKIALGWAPRWTRILGAAAPFAAAHLKNAAVSGSTISRAAFQSANMLGIGILLGNIMESPLGLAGSIGAHIAHNLISLPLSFL